MATVETIQIDPTYVLTLTRDEAEYLKWVLGELTGNYSEIYYALDGEDIGAVRPEKNPFVAVDKNRW